MIKTKRKRYIVVEGSVRGAIYADERYSIVRTDHMKKEDVIKKLNSNKSLHTILTTGSAKKAKNVIKRR